MLTHVIESLSSEGEVRLQKIFDILDRGDSPLDPRVFLAYGLISEEIKKEIQSLLDNKTGATRGNTAVYVSSDLFKTILKIWWPEFIKVIKSSTFIEAIVEQVSEQFNLNAVNKTMLDAFDQMFRADLLDAVLYHGSRGVDPDVSASLIIDIKTQITLQIPLPKEKSK
ncbi:hypothetical protein [Candidatus Chlamydia corallus]|uniref:hypothetical protein n=1 Tax=Candidatus Chlamydia corallus TaxID=2038470 RepID=UPI000C2F899E|nr:hypothetical protein [Candidatus Chlamydia corallus]